jgi:hypothetical protein
MAGHAHGLPSRLIIYIYIYIYGIKAVSISDTIIK